MKTFKSALSLVLAFCMVFSMTGIVYASETEQSPETEVVSETEMESSSETEEEESVETTEQEEPEKTEVSTEIPVEADVLKEEVQQEKEPASKNMGVKPADGVTYNQPFASETGESSKFRIPAIVTLDNGTIVAATDARWNTTGDGGGLDTIVSRSTDGGQTWNYTYANYLGDNGNVWNGASTAFIDPVLATDGKNVYMIVDLFPAGYALNSADKAPVAGENGFTAEGYLRLSGDNRNSYEFYLKGGQIYDSSNNVVNGYTVDAMFNLTGNGYDTNLFFADSPYQVYPTDYLYLTKSADGGATWSEPTLINAKKEAEQTYLVGPGRGLVTSTGRIIFPCYEHTSGKEHTSFIYSDDQGVTWTRTEAFADHSSETTLVEADGRLYAFFRCGGTDYQDIPYFVSNDDGATWTRGPKNDQIDPCTSCQMNAITYSEKIDGQTAILLSCPTGSGRVNGKIHVALVNEDGTLTWKYASDVISSSYSYSCMTELNDGSIGLLYEGGTGTETFSKIAISDIASGAVIGENETVTDPDTNVSVTAKDVTHVTVTDTNVPEITVKYVAYDITPYINDTPFTNSARVTIPLSEALKALDENNLTGFVVNEDGTITNIEGQKTADGLFYTFETPHFSKMGVMELAVVSEENIELNVGDSKTVTVDGQVGTEGDYTTPDGYVAYTIKHNSTTTPGGIKAEEVTNLTNGQYLIGDGTNWLTLNGNTLDNTTEVKKATSWTIAVSGNSYTIQSGKYLTTTGNNNNNQTLTMAAQEKNWNWSANGGFFYTYGNGGNKADFYLSYNDGRKVQAGTDNLGIPYKKVTTSDVTTYTTDITFTGKVPGKTTIALGETTYNVTVIGDMKTVDITLIKGTSQTFKVNSDVMTTIPDSSVATAEIVTKDLGYRMVDIVESGKQYLIVNDHAGRAVLTQTPGTNGAAKGFQLKVTNDSDVITGDEYANYLWTLEKSVSGNYVIKARGGQYLYINPDYKIQDVHLQETFSEVQLISMDIGTYKIKPNSGNSCLENQASANNLATGYYNYNDSYANQCRHFYEYSSEHKMTVTGVEVGKTTVVVGDTTYNITVREETPEDLVGSGLVGEKDKTQSYKKNVTKLTISVGVQYGLSLNDALESGQTVEWVSGNVGVATVDNNGEVTGVSVGNTQVFATVYDANHNIVAENIIDVVVLEGNGSNGAAENNDKVFDFYINDIVNTTVYYSFNCSTEMVEVQKGEVIYISVDKNDDVAMNFFAAPNEKHALTFMKAPGSAGEYESLQDKTNPENTDFYKFGAAKNQKDPFGDQTVKDMIQSAMDNGCDGAQGFTRAATDLNDCKFTLTFRSEKLPEITKEVVAIRDKNKNPRRYEEGMAALIGEEVFFRIVVHKEEYKDLIIFTDMKFVDPLNVKFYEDKPPYLEFNPGENNTVQLGTEFDTTNEVTKTYYVGYTITEADFERTITNTVDLTYSYSSQYTKGSFDSASVAEATITATEFAPEDIVIDFGLPVTIDFKDILDGINAELVSGKANYGTVTVDGTKVTYTPEQILPEADTVTLTIRRATKEETFSVPFNVYPATTVYYEEGFATPDRFTVGGKGTGTQATEIAGKHENVYGYDVNEGLNKIGPSNGTQATSKWETDKKYGHNTVFTFYGTGVDIYTNNTPTTGSIAIQVKNSAGKTVKLVQVRTAMIDGDSASTIGQEVTAYNVPVACLDLGTPDTYTVKITHIKQSALINGGDPAHLDGFRVYGTLNANTQAYVDDNEANPTFVELRDMVLAALNVQTDVANTEYADQIARNVLSQVYSTAGVTKGAVLLSANGNSTDDVQDMLDNGPKNELYLRPGQSVVFKPENGNNVQIGLKALNESVTYTITGKDGSQTLNASTDMFYNIPAGEAVTITNNSISTIGEAAPILSITKLKFPGTKGMDTASLFAELTEEDLVRALLDLGFLEEPDEPIEKPVEGETEAPTQTPTEAVTEATTEATTEVTSEAATTESSTETATEADDATEEVEATEESSVEETTEVATEEATEAVTEGATEPVPPQEEDSETSNILWWMLGTAIAALGAVMGLLFWKKRK